MNVFGNREIRLLVILLTSAILVTWMVPIGLLFAQDGQEEELMEETDR